MKKYKMLTSEFFRLYTHHRLSISASALSYYLTMTLFPIIICVYSMLGNNYDKVFSVIEMLGPILPQKTINIIEEFLEHMSENFSLLMMLFAISVIIITSSAAFRCFQDTISRMQGGRRYEGFAFMVFSIVLSLAFLAVVYIGIVALFFTRNLIRAINIHLPGIRLDNTWSMLKYVILFVISLITIIMIYEVCKRREDNYKTFPGAITATVGLVIVSVFFSEIINASVKYTLIYGWLGSVVVLMFWLYSCSLVIFCGAALNIAIRNTGIKKKKSAQNIQISDNNDIEE